MRKIAVLRDDGDLRADWQLERPHYHVPLGEKPLVAQLAQGLEIPGFMADMVFTRKRH
jgi:hypothetical protein